MIRRIKITFGLSKTCFKTFAWISDACYYLIPGNMLMPLECSAFFYFGDKPNKFFMWAERQIENREASWVLQRNIFFSPQFLTRPHVCHLPQWSLWAQHALCVLERRCQAAGLCIRWDSAETLTQAPTCWIHRVDSRSDTNVQLMSTY